MNQQEDLQALGEYFYGSTWQTSFARDLRINIRTMQRWVAGNAIPLGAWDDILIFAAKKMIHQASFIKTDHPVYIDSLPIALDFETELLIRQNIRALLQQQGYIAKIR